MNIIVHEAICRVDGNAVEKGWLANLLTIEKEGFNPNVMKDNKLRFYQDKENIFPTGLLCYVEEAAPNSGHTINIVDKRKKLDKVKPVSKIWIRNDEKLKRVEMYDFQQEGLRKIIKHQHGLVKVATGGGKTSLLTSVFKSYEPTGARGIIVTHSKEIYNQLLSACEDNLKKVGEVRSGKIDVKGKQTIVCMILTLLNNYGADPEVTKFVDDHQIILVDEAHRARADKFTELLKLSKAPVRVGFSGTIAKRNTERGMRQRAYLGDVLIEIRNSELIKRGINAKPKVKIIPCDSTALLKGMYYKAIDLYIKKYEEKYCEENPGKTPPNILKSPGEFWSRYHKTQFFSLYNREVIRVGMVENEFRNSLVAGIAEESTKSTLIIVDRLEHGQILQDMITKRKAVFLHGQVKGRKETIQKFKEGEVPILIATKLIDEGVDISGIECLILAGGMKSEVQLLQRIGRGLRRKPGENEVHVIAFDDVGNKYLEKYSAERIRIMQEESFEIERL